MEAVRKTVFSKSDAYEWKWLDDYDLIEFMPLEEYSEKLKKCLLLRRDNGILEARFHTNGGSLMWGKMPHKCIHQFFTWAGQDHNNEVLIFGGSGKDFFAGIQGDSEDPNETDRYHGQDTERENYWKLYETSYYDGANNIEGALFDLEIPTIAIWHGAAFHSDIFLFNDITLATEDAWMTEMHFRINMVPGDGVQIAWRELMGRKRFAYAELTGQIITARKALEYGMINEIQPDLEAAYSRAWEIAELIMLSGTRVTRRITTQILRTPWKEDVSKELRSAFTTELYTTVSERSPHDNMFWRGAIAEAEAVMSAEREGKIVRPRVGEFVAEIEIK